MKVSELRIGNLVNRLGVQTIIKSIQIDSDGLGFVSTPLSGAITINQIEPIPLTEEWLLKAGFEVGNKVYINAYSMNILNTDFYLRPSYNGGFYWGFNISNEKIDCELNNVKAIQYVHQLQNLYFALTGEELKFN